MPTDSVFTHVGGFTQTNGYLLKAPEGWIAVDAPDGISDFAASRGITLGALLLTHSHFDHVEDAAAIRERHGCPIFAWQESTPESRLEDWVLAATGMRLVVRDYPVDHLLAGSERIDVCGLTFVLAHVPGHSEDSVTFFDIAGRRLFTGDTLMHETMGRCDFPGGSEARLLAGICKKLLPFGDDVAFFPGHGPAARLGDERRWVEALARQVG